MLKTAKKTDTKVNSDSGSADLSSRVFNSKLAKFALGAAALLPGCATLQTSPQERQLPDIPTLNGLDLSDRRGGVHAIPDLPTIFTNTRTLQYTEFTQKYDVFKNKLNEAVDYQKACEDSYKGPSLVKIKQSTKTKFLEENGYYIEDNGIKIAEIEGKRKNTTHLTLTVPSERFSTPTRSFFKYDTYNLYIELYGSASQKIHVEDKDGLKLCSTLEIAPGRYVAFEYEDHDRYKSYNFIGPKHDDSFKKIISVHIDNMNLSSVIQHRNEYYSEVTNGSVFRSSLHLNKRDMEDDIRYTLKTTPPGQTPLFYTSYHGNVDYNRGINYISEWVDTIAKVVNEVGYQKPVTILTGNCYDGITQETVEAMSKLTAGSVLLTSNDFNQSIGRKYFTMLENNSSLVKSLLTFSSFRFSHYDEQKFNGCRCNRK